MRTYTLEPPLHLALCALSPVAVVGVRPPDVCGPVHAVYVDTAKRTLALCHLVCCPGDCPPAAGQPWEVQMWFTPDGRLHRDDDKPAIQRWTRPSSSSMSTHEHDNDHPVCLHGPKPLSWGDVWEESWWQHGLLHREEDLPAVTTSRGDKMWATRGAIHRPAQPHEPAVQTSFGECMWTNAAGQLHRDGDLAAVIAPSYYQEWYQHGQRHRDTHDAPAIAATMVTGCGFAMGNCTGMYMTPRLWSTSTGPCTGSWTA